MELGRGQVTPPASSRPALAARQHAMTGPHNGKTVKRCRSLFPDGLHRDRFRRVLLKSNWARQVFRCELQSSQETEGRMWLVRQAAVLVEDGHSLSSLIRASRHDSPRDAAIAEAFPAEERQRQLQGDALSVDLDVDGVSRTSPKGRQGRRRSQRIMSLVNPPDQANDGRGQDANGSPPIGVGDAEEGHLAAVIMAHPPPFIPFGLIFTQSFCPLEANLQEYAS